MAWYTAKIIFRISNGLDGHKSQFDEHLKLIEADHFDEAFLKARVLGLQEEASFLNDHRQLVKWEFVNVAEIIALRDLKDGLELYSQIHETEPAEADPYVHYVHQKAVAMQLRHRPVF